MSLPLWLDEIQWDDKGLVPVIAQDETSGRVMMFAYANKEAVALTAERHTAHYWTRSRQKLWHKGEESGHFQHVSAIELDCDGDVLIYKIRQEGGIACHTGRESCFFRTLQNDQWIVSEAVLKDPKSIYGANHQH
ncbi:phosphoribosyl-AMP cyclohydrolase [uncultured Deefgea sp.]|uniref:phosphoribosyl-AMP cyclohydrolase n=1 Tax=uncultured Deefgea sp. TaxID=1304914 RepID=UPI002639656D|nr:phosphoribosyl-AMP cyclohydrolase [uncultured Deefgea sp.]